MNLNASVVLPITKARSVKLNGRNMQELRVDTLTLDDESKEMEEKLQQLKDTMSKEKEERQNSRGLRWTSEKKISISGNSLPSSFNKNKETKIQKVSAGKQKIRVLKEEPLSAPAVCRGLTRGSRLKEKMCGQYEVKTAGLVFVVNDGEQKVGITEDDELGLPSTLLTGQYNEEESAQYFQDALRQWRGERCNEGEQTMTTDTMWSPVRSVSVSAVATQADFPPDREAEGRKKGGREGVMVEFTENSLTYVERLLLQKHRRTPFQSYHPSLDLGTDSKSSLTTDTEEDTANNLTGEEEDFHRYYTSLFAVPVNRGRTEPQTSTPESCLAIEILDETCSDIDKTCAAEQKMDKNEEVPSVQQISRRELTRVSKMALSSNRSSRAGLSSPSKTQPSRQSGMPVQSKAAKKLHSSQTSQPEHSVKALSSKSKTSTCPTAVTSGTSNKSKKKTASKSSMSMSSPSTMKSNDNCGSPLSSFLSPEIPKSSTSPLSFFDEVSALDGNMSANPEEHPSHSPSISFSLRSTFTVSPSSSTQSTFLPKVYNSTLLQKDLDLSLLSAKRQSSQLFSEPVSSLNLCEAPKGNLIFQQQSQHSMCDPDCLQSENQLNHSLSPMSATPYPKPESLEPVRSLLSPVPCGVYANSFCTSAEKYEKHPVFISSTPRSGDQKSSQFLQDPRFSSSSSLKTVINNPVKMDKVKEPSIDSGDEMSIDSLGLAEEDSSGEETQMERRLTREKSKEENHRPVLSHLDDSFILAEVETKKDLQTEEPEKQSKSFMVMQKQSAGSGSEQFCDLDGFLPLGLDTDTGHLSSPEHAHCEPLHTRHSSVCESDPTGCNLSDKPTPVLSKSSRRRRPLSAPTSFSLVCTPSPPLSARPSHLTPGSEFSPASRPFSRPTQEIMEICGVDQKGCEDPDLEMDITVHMLHSLEEELRVITKGLQSARNKRKRTKTRRETDRVSSSYPETQTQQSWNRCKICFCFSSPIFLLFRVVCNTMT
ncbi:uncharacterized protein zbbx isoform X2 [Melanotaenia boesemani]|uniref:uncharacterized protein zbbx isoform X2 n=1 Tax=Melanotaenia boesemani TaxID=1250792 RepID=UPI001C054165|nr:uncharacterized protein zbbx isoform X2 [Melanotaenia boesemani]